MSIVHCHTCNEPYDDTALMNHVRIMHPDQYRPRETWPDGSPLVLDQTDYSVADIQQAKLWFEGFHDYEDADPDYVNLRCPECHEVISRMPREYKLPGERPENDEEAQAELQKFVDSISAMVNAEVREHYARQHPDTAPSTLGRET